MIVTFCGHSQYQSSKEDEQTILTLLQKLIGDRPAEIYLGGYGSFDAFALQCCKRYQQNHPNVKLILVTPYITPSYQKTHLADSKQHYDEILYPPLENTPPKFAILYRNRWMIKQATAVIAYVDHAWGGAYQSYQHAKRKQKTIYNLAHFSA